MALVVTLGVAGGAASSARASDADVIREARDRAEIEQLMWRYARALDTANADAYVANYTEDGAFGKTKGREALHKMVTDLKKSQEDRKAKGEKVPTLYHMTANHYVEFVDKDHARLHNYWLTAFAMPPAPAGSPPAESRPPIVGRGVDELVRVNGRWLIKSRDVAPTTD